MKKLLVFTIVLLLFSGCRVTPTSEQYDPALWQSVAGSKHGGEVYDSDSIHDPAHRSMNGKYIW